MARAVLPVWRSPMMSCRCPRPMGIIASIDFDTTGTTRIGRYIFNHSFMLPGLLSMAFSLALGLLFAQMFF